MLVFQCQLYRKRLLWKISFGAENLSTLWSVPLMIVLRSTRSKRHCPPYRGVRFIQCSFREISQYNDAVDKSYINCKYERVGFAWCIGSFTANRFKNFPLHIGKDVTYKHVLLW